MNQFMKINEKMEFRLIKSNLTQLVMKTFIFLFCTTVFSFNVEKSFSQEKIIIENNQLVLIDEVFKTIQLQTDYDFIYPKGFFENNLKVQLTKGEISFEDLMNLSLSKTGLGYRVSENNTIIIEEKQDVDSNVTGSETIQQLKVSGNVTDSDGNPLPGASIIESGTTNGTTTDFDGNFTLDVGDENSTLEISFIGFEPQQITANVNESLNIQLIASVSGLDDVVVVGYGTAKQKDVTGAISSLKGEAIESVPVSTAEKAIQGRVAGVQIVRNGGAPGAGSAIRIRGTGTVNNADPLYIIDGVPTSDIMGINPNDIQSIEVLKDASASAIYGTRAANGVVIITTKRGRKGRLDVTLNTYTGMSNVVNTIDVLDAPTYSEIKRERYANDGIPVNPIWQDSKYQTQRTDWQDELFGTGVTSNFDLAVSGGSEKSTFLFSLGYYDEEGIIEKAKSDRFSLRVNSDHVVNDWLKIGQNLSLSTSENNGFNTTSAQNGLIFSAIRFHPGLPVKDSNGNYSSNQISGEFGDINNPLYEVDVMDRSNRFTRLLSNVNAEITITDDLRFKANFGYEASIVDKRAFYPVIADQIRQRANNEARRDYDQGTSFLMEYFIQYDKIFADNHSLGFVGGYTEQSFDTQGFSGVAIQLPDEDPSQRFMSTGTANAAEEYKSEDGLRSIFGRLNYSFKDTYLLTATVRSDESSKFASENQQGIFPAASVGWRVSNESFFEGVNFMDNLKLTAGWGQLGNQNIPGFQYLARIGRGARYSFGENQVVGANQISFANRAVTWETVVMTNIGASMTFLDNRLSANFNYFIKDTEDMLLSPPTIGSQGTTPSPFLNIGEIRNKGLEIELNWADSIGDFNYSIDANAAFVNNEVTQLVEGTFLSSRFYGRPNQEISRTYVGSPIATFYGWRADGLFQTQSDIDSHAKQPGAKPGDVRFVDLNGDNEIDADDREIIGSPHPKVTYGINTNLSYKAFDLNMFFIGAGGLEIYNADRMQGLDASYPFNLYSDITGRWTGPGTSNTIPRVSTLRENLNHRTSDLFIEKGDFLRLKNITLGYTLPSDMIDKIGLSRLRLYLSGQNVFILTDYSGLDPELGLTDNNLQQNVDFAQFPQARTFMLGANISF